MRIHRRRALAPLRGTGYSYLGGFQPPYCGIRSDGTLVVASSSHNLTLLESDGMIDHADVDLNLYRAVGPIRIYMQGSMLWSFAAPPGGNGAGFVSYQGKVDYWKDGKLIRLPKHDYNVDLDF